MLVLATDIDGTFLGGSLSDRNQLYQLIRSLGGEMLLIFVTGRALENIEPLLADPSIPNPDYIIADVGATVVHGETREAVEPLDRELAARWVGEEPILEALEALPPSLVSERQQQAQRRRCSFYTDDPEVVEAVRRAVAPLGCAVLYSADRYLDVLPVGIDKGHTLSKLIDHLGLEPEDVLVAGDSLNDLSVFTHTPFRGVVVGGGEPALREGTRHLAHVYQARAPGAAGILEAIETLGWLEAAEPRREPPGEAELVVVYHRQPFDEVVEEGVVRRRPPASPNGVIPTLLGLFGDGRRGAWVAWSTCEAEPGARFETRVRLEGGELPNLTISRLPLTAEEVDLFYKQLSKDALWPILHSFIERATFDHRQWQHFHHVNRLFAQRAAAESARGALVWIHDYNLWLVPEYLRRLRPDLCIALFHHTPFPAADIFNVIPWSREIVSSLLKCDYLGFHIPRYCENFVDAARSHFPLTVEERREGGGRFLASGTALSVERTTARIGPREPSTALGAHPVGLDVRRIETILATPELDAARSRLEEDLGGKKIVFCAQRLDYMKGPLQKLLAFERFLALYPVWREKITLIDICVPPAEGMGVYDAIRSQVEQAVGRINGRFSTAGWSPVKFLFRRVPFEEVVAYLAVADVAWITPLRDGLNLVAKEYVAVRTGLEKAGVLVISEFAGSSVELDGALLTNPYDIAEMADTLMRALGMEEAEQRRRMGRLGEVVRRYDVEHWARDFVASARGQGRVGRAERGWHLDEIPPASAESWTE